MMKRLAMTTAIVLATVAAVVLLWYWRGVVLIFFASLATAAAVRPLAEKLVERGWRRKRALGLTYTLVLALLCVLAVLLIEPLATDIESFVADARVVYAKIAESWPQGTRLQRMIARSLPAEPTAALLFGDSTDAFLTDSAMSILGVFVDATLVIVLSL
jgi:predicted PurR-regulated permease PerM